VNSLFDLPFEDEPHPEDVAAADAVKPADPLPTREAEGRPAAPREGEPLPAEATRGNERDAPGTRNPVPGTRSGGVEERARPRTYSVSELTHAVRQSLEHQFGRVWVEGEIADCTNSQGNIYFTLKDGGAQLPAVLWRTDAARLRFKLTTGLHVLVKGRLSVYVPRGRYQLLADSIEPKGAGALQLAFEQLKKRLQAEGLFDSSRKRPLPMLPRRIGVVTSLEGAALRDVLRVLRTRRAPADIVISPTRVQGDGASADIARAIARVCRVPGVDVLIVGRGGGSIEDLWAFNEETVARAIAAAPIPVIAAVGHEVDTTIADLVADVRAATPSQAGEIVVRQASDFRDRLAGARRQMALLLHSRLDRQRTRLLRIEQRPGFAHYRDDLRSRDRHRAELEERLTSAWRQQASSRGRRVVELTRRLDEQHPQRQLVTRMRRLAQVDDRLRTAVLARRTFAQVTLQARRDRLARVGLGARVTQTGRRVDQQLTRALTALTRARHSRDRQLSSLSAQLDALSPLKTLARGYAICWETPGGAVVRSVQAVSPGDRVHVQLPDGRLQCEVDTIEPDAPSRP
jgi:exodeoxyribonuclease VII large subunit